MSASPQADLLTVAGSVSRVITRNDSTGWAVLEIETKTGHATLIGSLAFVDEGLRIQAEGAWTKHATFGEQFKVTAARVFPPVGAAGIERFLKSGAVHGIGPVFAKTIVERFGEKTLDVIEKERWRLKYLKGVGPKRIDAVVQGMKDYRDRTEVMSFLHGQLGPIRAQRVFEKYGQDARDKIAENPYRLIDDFDGIGFLLADKVARDVGIGVDHPKRLQAAAESVLKDGAHQGHTCLPKDVVEKRLTELLGSAELAERALAGDVVDAGWRETKEEGVHYLELRRFHRNDNRVVELITRLTGATCCLPAIDATLAIPWAEKKVGLTFEAGQSDAITTVLANKVSIITGGPGVGKTTILNGLLKILLAKKSRVALAAPTGRAARRMADSTGHDAQTIHRLLEFSPKAGGFQRKASNPLEVDMVIIDEGSMMDLSLTRALLDAIPVEAKLAIVGDADQLPSVGAGNVLGDLIDSRRLPVARLTEPFRQASQSPIIRNAHLINAGVVPDLDGTTPGFEFIEARRKEDTAAILVDTICTRLPAEGIDPIRDSMCLAPMNKGVVGIEQINGILQGQLNPAPADRLERAGRVYGTGDRVIQLKNNRDLLIFNGDVGVIETIDHTAKSMRIVFETSAVDYPFSELYSLGLAYCLTVHRSQGSEYGSVVIAVDMSNSVLLSRKLLYTAVTRAKKRVILVGQKRAVHIAVSEARAYHRHTLLKSRLQAAAMDANDLGEVSTTRMENDSS